MSVSLFLSVPNLKSLPQHFPFFLRRNAYPYTMRYKCVQCKHNNGSPSSSLQQSDAVCQHLRPRHLKSIWQRTQVYAVPIETKSISCAPSLYARHSEYISPTRVNVDLEHLPAVISCTRPKHYVRTASFPLLFPRPAHHLIRKTVLLFQVTRCLHLYFNNVSEKSSYKRRRWANSVTFHPVE